MSDFNFDDMLKDCKDFTCKTYVPKILIKSLCPSIKLVKELVPGMTFFEIEHDKIEDFLKEMKDSIEFIYMPDDAPTMGETGIPNPFGHKIVMKTMTTFVLKCKLR